MIRLFVTRTDSAKIMLVVYAVMGGAVFFLFDPFDVLRELRLFSGLSHCRAYLGMCFSLLSFLILFLCPVSAVAGLIVCTRKSLMGGATLNYGLLALAWGGAFSFSLGLPFPKDLGLAGLYLVVLFIALGVVSLINLILLPFWVRNIRDLSIRRKMH